jgi:Acyl-protein synthetase, LuxE
MSELLAYPPYSERRDALLLEELNALTRYHLERNAVYRRIWPEWQEAKTLDGIPYLHAGVFKHLRLASGDAARARTLVSSGTAGTQSQVVLDGAASRLQAASSRAILAELIGPELTPLLILDHAAALRSRDAIPARIAAAMAVQPFATETHFVLDPGGAMDWSRVSNAIARADHIRVYAITSLLWTAWLETMPDAVREELGRVRIDFVHSGGWKKLEAIRVDRVKLDQALLEAVAPGSRVVDFYGLVEQNGILFPLCDAGFRHAPLWSEVIVRDPFTLQPASGEGLLQLMNPLPRGAPSHSVLTEDVGRLVDGDCACGWKGRRFELIGRLPKAEVRGCANV